ncbi:4Fe-4S binding protein [Escherichia coli]
MQPVNPHSADRPPVVSDAAPDFVKTVTAAMLRAGLGDALPVSALPRRLLADGHYALGNSRLAEEIPIWKEELCTQCNHCVAACPHSAIAQKWCRLKRWKTPLPACIRWM